MESGGSFSPGDDADDPGGSDDAPQRGWISPDDRLWRHPSELASGSAPTAASSERAGGWDRRTVIAAGAVGAVAVVLSMAAVFAMTSTTVDSGAHPVAVTVTSLTSATAGSTNGTLVGGTGSTAPTSPNVIAMVSALRPSLVGVVADANPSSTDATGTGTTPMLTGVVLPDGHDVATAASAVVGMHGVEVVTADGRNHQGTVEGSDERSGVAVVSVHDQLTPATFSDDDVGVGALTIAACLCGGDSSGSDGATGAPAVSVGMVRQSGRTVALTDGTSLVDAIESSAPLAPSSWGAVLLDRDGRVIGILDSQQQSGSESLGVFVPSSLAIGVAGALAGGQGMDHGWLGIVCTDADTTGATAGPTVSSLFDDGPAARAGIKPGDVIEAVGAHAVATVAELQARLYTATPGTTVRLTVAAGSGTESVPVTLSTEPT